MAVVFSIECRVAGMLLSPKILFREMRIESNLGSISSTFGIRTELLKKGDKDVYKRQP